MFEKTEVRVLLLCGGLYSLLAVFRLAETFYVKVRSDDKYARLTPMGGCSYKNASWSSPDGRLVNENGKLVLK